MVLLRRLEYRTGNTVAEGWSKAIVVTAKQSKKKRFLFVCLLVVSSLASGSFLVVDLCSMHFYLTAVRTTGVTISRALLESTVVR